MNPYIALTRPGNVVLTAVAVVAGSFIAAGDSILDFQVEIVIASLAAMMLAVSYTHLTLPTKPKV